MADKNDMSYDDFFDGIDDEDTTDTDTAPSADGDAGKDDAKGIKIPKHRFDEVSRENKRLKQQMEALTKQQRAGSDKPARSEPEPDTDLEVIDQLSKSIDKMDDEYHDAMVAGNTEAANNLRKDLRAARKVLAERQQAVTMRRTAENSREEASFQRIVGELEAKHPVIQYGNEDYDDELTNDILTYMNGIIATQKQPRGEALRMAVKAFSPQIAAATKAAAKAKGQEEDEEEDATPRGRGLGGGGSAGARALPPDTTRAARVTPRNVAERAKTLTGEQIDRLSPEALARLRGDYV